MSHVSRINSNSLYIHFFFSPRELLHRPLSPQTLTLWQAWSFQGTILSTRCAEMTRGWLPAHPDSHKATHGLLQPTATPVCAPQGVRDERRLYADVPWLIGKQFVSACYSNTFLCGFRGPPTKTCRACTGRKFPATIAVRQHPCSAAKAPPNTSGQAGGQSLLPQVQVSLYNI